MHILCNFGGEFAFIHNKNQYEGGETGLFVVDETCISYPDLLSRVKKFFATESESNIEIKYRYPGGSEVDDDHLVLVTLRNDDDMHNMIALHTNSLASMASASSTFPPPIQLFLFQTSDQNQSTATNETTLLPLRKTEKESIKVEETGLKEKQITSSSDKFNEKRRPKLVDMEWITGIAKSRIERNLPCEEKDIMDEIRNEYGFDVDYDRAWRCRNRALEELGLLPDEKMADKPKEDDHMPSKKTYVMSNMLNGPPSFPQPPPPMPDYDLSGLREDMSGLQAFLWEFRRNVLILLVVLLLLLLHFETK